MCSEFEEASYDRQRVSGALSLNSFRRNEYGSSPPSKAEPSNYSRRIHGKREVHSSGRSDKDSDSQSDRDSGKVSSQSIDYIIILFDTIYSVYHTLMAWLTVGFLL